MIKKLSVMAIFAGLVALLYYAGTSRNKIALQSSIVFSILVGIVTLRIIAKTDVKNDKPDVDAPPTDQATVDAPPPLPVDEVIQHPVDPPTPIIPPPSDIPPPSPSRPPLLFAPRALIVPKTSIQLYNDIYGFCTQQPIKTMAEIEAKLNAWGRRYEIQRRPMDEVSIQVDGAGSHYSIRIPISGHFIIKQC